MRLPPLGARSWSGPGFLPGTGRGFSIDNGFPACPLTCESLPKPWLEWEKHAGSLEALRVTRPEAVGLAGTKAGPRSLLTDLHSSSEAIVLANNH